MLDKQSSANRLGSIRKQKIYPSENQREYYVRAGKEATSILTRERWTGKRTTNNLSSVQEAAPSGPSDKIKKEHHRKQNITDNIECKMSLLKHQQMQAKRTSKHCICIASLREQESRESAFRDISKKNWQKKNNQNWNKEVWQSRFN